MDFSEAEIQVLASLEKAGIDGAPTDRSSLEAGRISRYLFHVRV